MKFLNASSIRAAAATFALAAGLSLLPHAAGALVIRHNGFGTGGIIQEALEAVDVGLTDLRDSSFSSDLADVCDGSEVDACLLKVWLPGSQNDGHAMQITPDGDEFALIEFVVNASGVPWTDYHLEFEGANIPNVETEFFLLDEEGNLVFAGADGVTIQDMGSSLWFFFDEPFPSTGFPPEDEFVAFGMRLVFVDPEEPFLIAQHPSFAVPAPGTLAIFGLGLAGIGWARRRRT